jgi:hypothetical protein
MPFRHQVGPTQGHNGKASCAPETVLDSTGTKWPTKPDSVGFSRFKALDLLIL